jgi:hypothetical protein
MGTVEDLEHRMFDTFTYPPVDTVPCANCGSSAIIHHQPGGCRYECCNPACPPACPATHLNDDVAAAAGYWNWLQGERT